MCSHLRSILQALQLVFFSNVCIWKSCWLAVARSGLMLELDEKFSHEKFRKKHTRVRFLLYTQYAHGHLELLHPLSFGVLRLTEELEALLAFQMDQVEAIGPLHGAQTAELNVH